MGMVARLFRKMRLFRKPRNADLPSRLDQALYLAVQHAKEVGVELPTAVEVLAQAIAETPFEFLLFPRGQTEHQRDTEHIRNAAEGLYHAFKAAACSGLPWDESNNTIYLVFDGKPFGSAMTSGRIDME